MSQIRQRVSASSDDAVLEMSVGRCSGTIHNAHDSRSRLAALLHYRTRYLTLLCLLLIASFSMAPMDAVGIAIGVPKLLCEATAWFLVGWSLWLRWHSGKRLVLRADILLPLLLVSIIGYLGSVIRGEGVVAGVLFVRNALSFLPLFIALQNLPLRYSERRQIGWLVVGLLLIQLPVSWMKAATYGVDESHWIGTLHNSAGELGLLLPLIAVSMLAPLVLALRVPKSLLALGVGLVLAYGYFGIIAEKRAVVFVFPLWLCLSIVLYWVGTLRHAAKVTTTAHRHDRSLFCRSAALVAVAGVILLSGSMLIPSLNPEEKVGGTLSAKHVAEYTTQYLSRDYDDPLNASALPVEENRNIQMGRVRVTMSVLAHAINADGSIAAFGYGGSSFSKSYLLGEGREDIMYDRIGIRGAASGAAMSVLETGLAGLGLMTGWLCWMSFLLLRGYWHARDSVKATGHLMMLLVHGVVVFDYFVYSNAIWSYGVLSPLYFVLLGLHLHRPIGKRDLFASPRKEEDASPHAAIPEIVPAQR